MGPRRVAYFTAGTVGAGHLVRGIAIGRGLARLGFAGDYRMFGPSLPYPIGQRPDYVATVISRDELRSPGQAPHSQLARHLAEFAPDLLVVDMFWAPLRWVLPLPACAHWLLIRKCPDAWFVGPADAPFDAGQYERVIAIEPLHHDVITDMVDPVVVCNRAECRPADALRNLLAVPDDRRLVVVAHAGDASEVETIHASARAGHVVRFDLHDPAAPFPLAEWLPGADAVCTAAGYNSFWEARLLGYVDRTRFTPLPRAIDDQQWRLDSCSDVESEENGADQLARWIIQG